MLCSGKTDFIEENDITKSSNSKNCMVCDYWFFNLRFKFQDFACKGCHDLSMSCLNISDIVIIIVKGVAYRLIIHAVSMSGAIDLVAILC